jgi:hypothetical protein
MIPNASATFFVLREVFPFVSEKVVVSGTCHTARLPTLNSRTREQKPKVHYHHNIPQQEHIHGEINPCHIYINNLNKIYLTRSFDLPLDFQIIFYHMHSVTNLCIRSPFSIKLSLLLKLR